MVKKLLCVVLASSLLLLTLVAGASSPPPLTSTLSRQRAQVLGRKGKLHLGGQLGYRYHQEGRRIQSSEEVVMEVKKPVENKAGWTGQGEVDGKEKGPIYSADYEGVVMHAGSRPKRKHPKP